MSTPERYQRPPLSYRRFGGGYRREDVESALTELYLALGQLDNETNSLRERNRDLEAELAAGRSEMEALRARFRDLEAELAAAGTEIESFGPRARDLEAELAATRTEIEALRAKEHEFSQPMAATLRRAAEIEEGAQSRAREIIAEAEDAATQIRSEASRRIEDSTAQFEELLRLKDNLLNSMRGIVADFNHAISRVGEEFSAEMLRPAPDEEPEPSAAASSREPGVPVEPPPVPPAAATPAPPIGAPAAEAPPEPTRAAEAPPEPTPAAEAAPEPTPAAEAAPEPTPAAEAPPEPEPIRAAEAPPEPTPAAEAAPEPTPAAEAAAEPAPAPEQAPIVVAPAPAPWAEPSEPQAQPPAPPPPVASPPPAPAPPPPVAPPPPAPAPPPPVTPPTFVAPDRDRQPEPEGTIFDTRVELDAGPFSDFAALSAFERALTHLPKVEDVQVRDLADDRALIELTLSEPAPILQTMRATFPYGLDVRSANRSKIVINVAERFPRPDPFLPESTPSELLRPPRDRTPERDPEGNADIARSVAPDSPTPPGQL